MNIDYEYLGDNLSRLTGLPVKLYDGDQLLYCFSNINFSPDPITLVLNKIFNRVDTVYYYDINSILYIGIIKVKANNLRYIVGPTSQLRMNEASAVQILHELGISKTEMTNLLCYLHDSPNYPLENFLHILCFVNYALNNEKKSVKDIITQETSNAQNHHITSERHYNQRYTTDDTTVHNTYELEKKIMNIVKLGRVEELQALFDSPPAGRPGKMAYNELRQRKNLFICTATLVCRAAIEGGLPQEIAFSMSDLYIQKAELLTEHNKISLLSMEMLCDYTSKVNKFSLGGRVRSNFVRKVAKYIYEHIDDKITGTDIANYLNENRTYLCKRFKQETGVTLNEFIISQKISEAKRLLITTDQSIGHISEYLSFSSQSYFQNIFKKYEGCSPKYFRENNEIK